MKLLLVASLLLTSSGSNAASTQTPNRKQAERPICSLLMTDYDNVSKMLAALEIEVLLHNRVAKAAARQHRRFNDIWAQARVSIDLLKSNGCKGPNAAPSASRYVVAALRCINAQSDHSTRAAWATLEDRRHVVPQSLVECDQSAWVPN
jgi:hypothetical protein